MALAAQQAMLKSRDLDRGRVSFRDWLVFQAVQILAVALIFFLIIPLRGTLTAVFYGGGVINQFLPSVMADTMFVLVASYAVVFVALFFLVFTAGLVAAAKVSDLPVMRTTLIGWFSYIAGYLIYHLVAFLVVGSNEDALVGDAVGINPAYLVGNDPISLLQGVIASNGRYLAYFYGWWFYNIYLYDPTFAGYLTLYVLGRGAGLPVFVFQYDIFFALAVASPLQYLLLSALVRPCKCYEPVDLRYEVTVGRARQ